MFYLKWLFYYEIILLYNYREIIMFVMSNAATYCVLCKNSRDGM